MKKSILSAIAAFTLIICTSYACDIHGISGFAPENNLRISQWDKASNGMTKEKYLTIIKSVSDIYTPVVKEKGVNLLINNLWDNDIVNATATRGDKTWYVDMFGGLARNKFITDDGFALVICHELGHHLGGAPHPETSWSSSEGQADYFGSMKCLRRVFEKQDNIAVISKMTVDIEVTKQCEMVYKNASEVALCQRVAMAGKSVAKFSNSLGGSSVNFDTPDTSVVSTTNDDHPNPQCRLDTFFQGILCDKSYDQENDKDDPTIGACIARDGYKVGPRPLCWYKPGAAEI